MKVFFSVLMLAITAVLLGGGWWLVNRDKVEKQQVAVESEREAYAKQINQLTDKLVKATNVSELETLGKEIKQLKKEDERRLQPLLDLAFAEYYYHTAEDNVFRAKSILEATGGTVEDGEVNVIADKYIKQAFDYYAKAKEKIDSLPELENDADYNFHFYYAKGNIYYRYLLLLATRQEALEIFNQTAASWGAALRFKEKDIDTEINLEMLNIKKGQALENAARGGRKRVQILPQQPNKGRGGQHGVI